MPKYVILEHNKRTGKLSTTGVQSAMSEDDAIEIWIRENHWVAPDWVTLLASRLEKFHLK